MKSPEIAERLRSVLEAGGVEFSIENGVVLSARLREKAD